jgi:hypothetical protein
MFSVTRNLSRTQAVTNPLRILHLSTLQSAIPITGEIHRPTLKICREFAQKYHIRRIASSDVSESLTQQALARARMPREPIKNPSKRTPNTPFIRNYADRIEKALNKAGFRSWGFPIYRRTYQSDSDWAEFLRRYRWYVTESLKEHNGIDLLDTLEITVFENQEVFEGASTATIREHFQQWATTAIQEEQDVSPDMLRYSNFAAARYRFCLSVDEESLQSVLEAPFDYYGDKGAIVNMLSGWWKEEPEEYDPEDYDSEDLEDGKLKDSLIERWDPIEGCTLENVGWMKVSFRDVGVRAFAKLAEHNEWDSLYVRPFEICHYL